MNKNEFVNQSSELVEKYFPKGKTKMRGEAMVLVAEILGLLLAQGVIDD